MGQILTADKIGKLVRTSTTVVTLPVHQAGKNIITVGGQQYIANALLVTAGVSGFGGIDTGVIQANKLYYVYAVLQAGVLGLVASLSEIAPTGFAGYKKVGAFYTDAGSTNIWKAYYFGEINPIILTGRIAGSPNLAPVVSQAPVNFLQTPVDKGGSTGSFGVLWVTGIFSAIPAVTAYTEDQTSGDEGNAANNLSLTGVNIIVLANSVQAAKPFTITANKQGIDAAQPDWSR